MDAYKSPKERQKELAKNQAEKKNDNSILISIDPEYKNIAHYNRKYIENAAMVSGNNVIQNTLLTCMG